LGGLPLHRADAEAGFSGQELAVLRKIAPHLAEGLRSSVIRERVKGDGSETPVTPGVIVLDGELQLVSINPEAERWLTRLPAPRLQGLPLPVYSVAARLASSHEARVPEAPERAASDHHGSVRLRTSDGHWLALHSTRLRGTAGDQICVVIEPAPSAEIRSLLLAAHGLTPAQNRVAALVLQGCSTREIVTRLHVSAYTVQEHLTAAFTRFGVGSRRELITAVLS
jgi:DNA-binding CsgD family transcriptional regulator